MTALANRSCSQLAFAAITSHRQWYRGVERQNRRSEE